MKKKYINASKNNKQKFYNNKKSFTIKTFSKKFYII